MLEKDWRKSRIEFVLKNSNSKILIMIKLYNYLSRQRRAYFFFSLNFVSQRMRKEKKISRIRCLKIGLLGRKIGFYEAHPNCSFLYSFFPALAITLRTCFTGEKTVFLRFSRGKVVRDDEQPPRAVCLEAS